MSLFKFDSDATFMEKFVTVFAPVLAGSLLLFLYLSAFGVFHNFYSEACQAAKPGILWKLIGLASHAFAVRYLVGLIKNDYDYEKGSYPIMFAFTVIGFAAFAGFAYPYIF